jgi:hypothetical protein
MYDLNVIDIKYVNKSILSMLEKIAINFILTFLNAFC